MTNEEALQTMELMKAEIKLEYPIGYQIASDIAIESLEKQTYWTPVNEKLPEDFDKVIVTLRDDSGDHVNYYTDIGFRCNGCWVVDDDISCQVSHWMPYPSPCIE